MAGRHFAPLSSRLTFFSSTSRSSRVDTYEIATAPLRKCICGVAGTPVIESPTPCVSASLPFTVTRTITAFRCRSASVSLTIFSTASALAVSVDAAGGEFTGAPQPASRPSTQRRGTRRLVAASATVERDNAPTVSQRDEQSVHHRRRRRGRRGFCVHRLPGGRGICCAALAPHDLPAHLGRRLGGRPRLASPAVSADRTGTLGAGTRRYVAAAVR